MVERAKRTAKWLLRHIRRRSERNLFWWKGPPYNVGDWIGPYLYRAITAMNPVHKTPSNRSLSTVYLTVGSLARWFCEDSIVWGSGIIERDETFWEPLETWAVRGPQTRARFQELAYPCPAVYGDPAILLPDFFDPRVSLQYSIGVVPHYSNLEEARNVFSGHGGIRIVDVRQPVEPFVEELVSCQRIISSSLHGLIVGHAFAVPAARGVFSALPGGDGIKFRDYTEGVGLPPLSAPIVLSDAPGLSDMEDYVDESPLPDLLPVRQRLLEACPFRADRAEGVFAEVQ